MDMTDKGNTTAENTTRQAKTSARSRAQENSQSSWFSLPQPIKRVSCERPPPKSSQTSERKHPLHFSVRRPTKSRCSFLQPILFEMASLPEVSRHPSTNSTIQQSCFTKWFSTVSSACVSRPSTTSLSRSRQPNREMGDITRRKGGSCTSAARSLYGTN